MTERRGHLAKIADGYASPELEILFENGRERQFQTGEHLLTEGESTEYFFDIISGTVAIARNGADGRRQILSFLGPRRILGAASTPGYPNLATALTPVIAVSYPRSALEKALNSTPGFASRFRMMMTRMVEGAHDHVYTLGQRSAIERIASFLLYLMGNKDRFSLDSPKKKSEVIELPMTRLDIADFLGLTIETVSRAFSSLKKQGVIEFQDSHSCRILNMDTIREIGGRDDFTEYRGA